MNKIHIIGASFAGMACAQKLAQLLPNKEIILIDKEQHSEYIPNGINAYLRGQISDISEAKWQPDQLPLPRNITFINAEVTSIVASKNQLHLRSSEGGASIETYETLVCAMGAKAKSSFITGSSLEDVMTTKSYSDSKKCLEKIKEKDNIIIVGSGVIGLDLAYSLSLENKDVTILEATQDLNFRQLDQDMMRPILDAMAETSVTYHTNSCVKEIKERENGLSVFTDLGEEFKTDLVILAVNFRPNSQLLEEHGLCHLDKTVKVNDHFQTDFDNIYAIGDLIALDLATIKVPYYNPLINQAVKTGEKLAYHLAGYEIPTISTTKVMGSHYFGYYVSSVGLTEEEGSLYHQLVSSTVKLSLDTKEQSEIWIKLIAEEKTGLLKGCQIVSKVNHLLLANHLSQSISSQQTDLDLAFQDFIYTKGEMELAYCLHQAALALFEKRRMQ